MAKGEVDLIIKAKNEASKALDAISSSLKNLTDQQIIAGDAADKADGQLGSLSLELTKLRTNAQNLQQLANIGAVLDKASAAIARQQEAAAQARAEEEKLAAQSTQLRGRQQELAESFQAATANMERQRTAVAAARTALNELNKESTAVSTGQRNAQRSLDAVTKLISVQEAALSNAAAKHAQLAAAVDATDKPTKRLTASLEAAERALTKRQAALDASRQKEAALRDTLTANAAAQEKNTAAVAAAQQQLQAEQRAADAAKSAVAALRTESSSLAKSQQALSREMDKSATASAQMESGLEAAKAEFGQLQSVADQARAKVGQSAASMTETGQAAVQASAQLATFAARLKVIQAGSGTSSLKTSALDPSTITSALNALSSAEAVVKAFSDETSRASVTTEALENAIKSAGAAGSTLTATTDAVAHQRAAIAGAEASWKTAEAEVKRLAIAMQTAEAPTEALAAAFGQAQGQARLAKDEFLNQKKVGDQLASTLEKAGVGAGTLSSAEAALAGSARATTAAVDSATSALNQMQTAQEKVAQPSLWERLRSSANNAAGALGQAAGAMARIRSGAVSASGPIGSLAGELRGLAAQVAGLYAIKQGIESVIETSNSFDALSAKLGVAFAGDVNKANTALKFSLDVAKNLKLPLLATADSYAQLAAAARGTTMEGEGVNKIFVAFAQSARVTRTSSAELKGIFNALTQSISKGKVQAEELRGQLGDRLPGAIQLMATGLGVSTEKLEKMLDKGQLTTDTLVRMASEVSGRVAPELLKALNSPQAKLQAFQNSWTQLQLQLAQSGFLDAIADAAERLGDALSRPETVSMVTDLGHGLADLVNYLGQIEDPLGKIKLLVEALLTMQLVSWVGNLATGLSNLAQGTYTLTAALAGLSPFLATIIGSLGIFAGIFATAWLADWAYDNFPVFREAIWSIGTATQSVGSTIQLAFELAFAYVKRAIIGFVNDVKTSWTGMISDLASSAASVGSFFGSDTLKGWAEGVAQDNANAADQSRKDWENAGSDIDAAWARYAQRQKDRDAEIAGQREKYSEQAIADAKTANDLINQLANNRPGITSGVGLDVVTGPSGSYKPDTSDEDAKAAAKAAKKRAQLEKSVADQISAIRARLDQNRANDLDTQLAGVEEKYKRLYADLTQLGLNETSEQWKTVDALKAQEMQLVRNKAAKAAQQAVDKQQREAEAQINGMLSLRKELLDQIKYAEGKGDYATADKLKGQYDALNITIKEAIDKQIQYWEASNSPNADLAIAKLKAQADGLNNVKNKGIVTAQSLGQLFGSNLKSGIDSFVDSVKETGDLFGSLKDSFLSFVSSFLAGIAKMILQQVVFNALQSAAGSTSGTASSFLGAAAAAVASAHTGGIAGSPGLNQRSVNPGMFSNAVRYHTGGVVGLQPWEVPIVAKKNEEVLTEDDPRHINNLGSAPGAGAATPPQNIRVINTIDSGSFISAGMSTPAGQTAIYNYIKANASDLKTVLK